MANILAIDDQAFMLRIIADVLEKAGHSVQTATDGAQALDMMQQAPPDLVLCDISMGGMDGYEVLARIRENPAWTNLPVVMLTAHDHLDDLERAQALGTDTYITKPFSTAQLIQTVNQYLGTT